MQNTLSVLHIENNLANRKSTTQLRVLNSRFVEKTSIRYIIPDFMDERCHVNSLVTEGVQGLEDGFEVAPVLLGEDASFFDDIGIFLGVTDDVRSVYVENVEELGQN